ncbi:hypothetical protein BwSH20_74050 [Bradyrhizobium ottawaense]|nr:hypothetical protein BwSH20_74050 [Bradyrhizobium ottawaense]GMO17557.1 hypothetical protein BwSF12_04190 [Bradyrhizobium ottawaense]GMO79425.1 hypothetical protein BwSG20_56730 [Bradyrhizobium ottawaense]GMO87525.1 hypothetical protein BwSG10_69500 [Bradyrhizobium ottawaense]GMP11918.1 hypothetical protein BwDG23_69500 [Bradyrhizobium ottawaense]
MTKDNASWETSCHREAHGGEHKPPWLGAEDIFPRRRTVERLAICRDEWLTETPIDRDAACPGPSA